jgi:hypothetical protein
VDRCTQIAFGLLLVIALTWSAFFFWTVTRRKVLLAWHRVLAGRLAVLFCSLFTLGALALALTSPTGGPWVSRWPAWAAFSCW